MRKRANAILVRLSDTEITYLEQQAQNAGLKKEPYIRKLIMGTEIRPRPPDTYAKLLRELSAIGNNINQLAYKANGIGVIQVKEVQKMREALDKIWYEMKWI